MKKLYILLSMLLCIALLAGCAETANESAFASKDESSAPIMQIGREESPDVPSEPETSDIAEESEPEPEPLPPLLTGEVWRAPTEYDAHDYLASNRESENGFAMARMRSAEDVQAFLDACPETAALIADSEEASERFASFDETFFASYDLAVLYIGDSGTPRYVVEGERWTNDGGQSIATIQIRCYQPYWVNENYVCWLKLLPLNKAASDACDVLSSRYLYGHIREGHDHEEPIDPTVSGETPSYPDDLSVTVSKHGALYETASLTGSYAKQLLGLLETLIYTQENVCACKINELWDKPIVVDDTYMIFMAEGIVRCEQGQAYLTQEQIKLINDAERYLSMQYWSFGWLSTVFGCDDLTGDAFFADGELAMIKTDEDWQAFLTRCIPADVPESHRYFFFNRIKYEPDFFKWYDIAAVLFRAEDATALDAQTAVLKDGTALLEVRYADWDEPKTESESGYMIALFMVNEYFVPQVNSWEFAVTNKPSEDELVTNTAYDWDFQKGWPVYAGEYVMSVDENAWPLGDSEWSCTTGALAAIGEKVLFHVKTRENCLVSYGGDSEKLGKLLSSLGVPYERCGADIHLNLSRDDSIKLAERMTENGWAPPSSNGWYSSLFCFCKCDDRLGATDTVSQEIPKEYPNDWYTLAWDIWFDAELDFTK